MMKIMSNMWILTKVTTDKNLDPDHDQFEKYLAAVSQSGRWQSHEIATAAGKSEVCRKSMPTLTTNCPDQDNDRDDDVGDDDDNDDDDSGDVCIILLWIWVQNSTSGVVVPLAIFFLTDIALE